jgi:hypothetical protein
VSSDFAFGTGDFTVEMFVYHTDLTGQQTYFGDTYANTSGLYLYKTSTNQISTYDTAQRAVSGANVIKKDQWHHLAWTVSSGVLRQFVDGNKITETSYNGNYTTTEYFLGDTAGTSSGEFIGFMSNARIIKGTALYTSNFTPPTRTLTNVTNTKLLCCQSNLTSGAAAVSPNISGVNDGTAWSSFIDGTIYGSSYIKTNMFDGVATQQTRTIPLSNTSMTWAPPSPISISSSLRLYCYCYNNINTGLKINGTNYGNAVHTANGTSMDWYTVPGPPATLTSLEWTTGNAGAEQGAFSAVEVDGTILVDPVIAKGNAVATNFNPFTTDIDAVRGQETGYCTMNPLDTNSGVTLSNGNLQLDRSANGWDSSRGTIGMTSGKWYFEHRINTGLYTHIGIQKGDADMSSYVGDPSTGWSYSYEGKVYNNSVDTPYGNSYTTGDLVACAFDADTGKLYFYKNGVIQNAGDPAYIGLTTEGPYFPAISLWASNAEVNFGQKPFKFPPPDGFQPLNATNLRPETVISRSDQFVGATIYTGNQTARSILTGHAPDLVWIKDRTQGHNHQLLDTVRGAPNILQTDQTVVEITDSTDSLTSFNYNGFTLGANALGSQNYEFNKTGNNYVAWTWRAGGNKNTYNVDDVGYANASDVNMSVGSLNSSVYNQTQTWSNNITTTANSGNFISKTAMFDADLTNYTHCNGDGLAVTVTFTINPPVPIKESITLFGGLTSRNAGTISINGGPTFSLTLCAAVDPSFTDSTVIPFTGLVNQITVKRTSTASAGLLLFGWKFDKQMLIDNGVTPNNVPLCAPVGCSVGTKQGFSIIRFNYSGLTGSFDIPHGLNKSPDFIIIKNKNRATSWFAFHSSMGVLKYIILSGPGEAQIDAPTLWGKCFPINDSVFGATTGVSGQDSDQTVAYCWHNVPGLQKFGSYTGVNSADGPFLELGFRPSIIMFKNISSGSTGWVILDNKRNGFNGTGGNNILFPNTADAENATQYGEFLSNGWKFRINSSYVNSTDTFIYCAWAEAPSIDLYGGGANAR